MQSTSLRLPDFLVIGTQKGGTTSLQQCWPATVRCSCLLQGGGYQPASRAAGDWYAAHYSVRRMVSCAATSPSISFIRRSPSASMLCEADRLLRDPVERVPCRCCSSRCSQRRRNRGTGATGQLRSFSLRKLAARSRLEQLQRYEALFPAKQCWCCAKTCFKHRQGVDGFAVSRLAADAG